MAPVFRTPRLILLLFAAIAFASVNVAEAKDKVPTRYPTYDIANCVHWSDTPGPTETPTAAAPTTAPTHKAGTQAPTQVPTKDTAKPTSAPTAAPTKTTPAPTSAPTAHPSKDTEAPSGQPTRQPTRFCVECAEGYGVPSGKWWKKDTKRMQAPWKNQFPGADGTDEYHGQVCVKCAVEGCAECDGEPDLCNRCADGLAQAGVSANARCVAPGKSTGAVMLVSFAAAGVLLGCIYWSYKKRAQRFEARRIELGPRGGGGEQYKTLVEA